MTSKLRESVKALKLGTEDAAAVALAECYAELIDKAPELVADLGPKLLAALDALGATPKARKAAPAPSRAANRLLAMRDARAS